MTSLASSTVYSLYTFDGMLLNLVIKACLVASTIVSLTVSAIMSGRISKNLPRINKNAFYKDTAVYSRK